MIAVYTLFESLAQAEDVANILLEEHLIACANIFPQVVSIYRWEGKRCRSHEVACLLKTNEVNRALLIKRLESLHPYACPAVMLFDNIKASDAFGQWIVQQTSSAKEE